MRDVGFISLHASIAQSPSRQSIFCLTANGVITLFMFFFPGK